MGADPGEAYVSFRRPALPAWSDDVLEIARMEAVYERTGTTLAGGDLVRSLGYRERHRRLLAATTRTRLLGATARPGDGVYLTGPLGLSAGVAVISAASRASARTARCC